MPEAAPPDCANDAAARQSKLQPARREITKEHRMSKGKGSTPFPGQKGRTGAPAGNTPPRAHPPAVVPRVAVRTKASAKGR